MSGVSLLERHLRYLHQKVDDLEQQAGINPQLSPQPPSALYVAPQWVIPGGGSVITAGFKGRIRWKGQGTIVGWFIFGSPNGTITFDVKKSTFAAYPVTSSICGGNFPVVSPSGPSGSAVTPLTGWTTTLNDGDVLECYVTGTPTGFTDVTIQLDVVR